MKAKPLNFGGVSSNRGAWVGAVLVAFALFACHETEEGTCVMVFPCQSEPPQTALLKVEVSPGVQSVAIYAGDNIETGRLVLTREAPDGNFSVSLPLGNYSAVARYLRVEQTVLAVDADELSYSQGEECDQDCYTAKDGVVQLTLGQP